jgi:hypothetical protein
MADGAFFVQATHRLRVERFGQLAAEVLRVIEIVGAGHG